MADDIADLPSAPAKQKSAPSAVKAAGATASPAVNPEEPTTIAAPAPAKPPPTAPASDMAATSSEDGDRSGVFTSLVTADSDVVGLVAYSIYKQNKHDWLVAFRRQRGRDPLEAEVSAYILGEGTARRLATYRHLALSTIEGTGPEVSFAEGSEGRSRPIVRTRPGAAKSTGLPVWAQIAFGLLAVVLIFLAARYGVPGIERAG